MLYFTILLTQIASDMRRDVQEIFKITPHEKQVMMFSATLSKEIRPVCRKFMQDVSCKCSILKAKLSFYILFAWLSLIYVTNSTS